MYLQRSHLAAAANLIKAREPLRKFGDDVCTNWAVIKATKSITRRKKTIKTEYWALVDLQILLSTRLNCRYRNRITISILPVVVAVLYCHWGFCVNSRPHRILWPNHKDPLKSGGLFMGHPCDVVDDVDGSVTLLSTCCHWWWWGCCDRISLCPPEPSIFNAALSRFVFRAGGLQYFP